ncbi:MAG TPA: hypothetical protein VFB08_21200 [Burkholderiales bacterium]|nr:hypothetical protein [Burkholderiales bacterium]
MARASGVSVHYPFAIVECLGCEALEEPGEAQEYLLRFRDEDGCAVTLRVRRPALEVLAQSLPR